MLNFFVAMPRWLFLATLVYAPWAYGCTEQWSVEILEWLMNTTISLWLISLVFQKRLPIIHPVVSGSVILLLAQGWLMTINAHYALNSEVHIFHRIESWWPSGPGSVDKGTSLSMINRISGLLSILCLACDLAQSPVWRERILKTIGGVGASIILLGLVQRVTAAPMIFWEQNQQGSQFFATYYYHGNAASYINLILPATAGMLWWSIRKPRAFLGRAFWITAISISVAGALVNVSRAGMIISGILIVVLVCWRSKYLVQNLLAQPHKTRLLEALVVLLALSCIVASVGWHRAADRWGELSGQLEPNNARWLTASVCLRMIPEAGAFGFGPGTFEITFPHFTGVLGNAIAGIWRYAHQDYLQTIIEWGWIGGAAWGVLLIGGITRAYLAYYIKSRQLTFDERILLFLSATALVGVMLHAMVDFPLQIASLQLYAITYTGLAWGTGSPSKT